MSFPRYAKYKASGVEWLGDVPEHWEIVRLKSLFQLASEKATERLHPLGLENIEGWSGRLIETETVFEGDGVRFKAGDLLFGKLRPYLAKLHVAVTEGEAVGDFHVMRPKRPIRTRFSFYQLIRREVIGLIDGSTYGAKMPRVGWDFLSDLPMVVPSSTEQAKIIDFLDRETAKIDGLVGEQERLIELLQEKRQAVISHAVTKGLDPHAPMKPSGVEWLGEVPANWDVISLKRVGTIKYGIGEPPEYHAEGTQLIRATNVDAGHIRPEGMVFIDPADLPEGRAIWLKAGDIIVVRSGAYTADSAIIREDHLPAIAGFDMVIRPIACNPEFLQYVLLSFYLKNRQLDVEKLRAAQPHLNSEELGSASLLLPPAREQAEIVRHLAALTSRVDTLIAETQRAIALLQARRAALISAAVTGQIDVRGLVAEAEAA